MNDFLLLFFLLSSSFLSLSLLSSGIRHWTHATSIHFNENLSPLIPVSDHHSHSINYFLTNFFMSKLNTTLPPLILPFSKFFLIIRSATRSKQVGISVQGTSAVLDNLIFTIGREERFVCLYVYMFITWVHQQQMIDYISIRWFFPLCQQERSRRKRGGYVEEKEEKESKKKRRISRRKRGEGVAEKEEKDETKSSFKYFRFTGFS